MITKSRWAYRTVVCIVRHSTVPVAMSVVCPWSRLAHTIVYSISAGGDRNHRIRLTAPCVGILHCSTRYSTNLYIPQILGEQSPTKLFSCLVSFLSYPLNQYLQACILTVTFVWNSSEFGMHAKYFFQGNVSILNRGNLSICVLNRCTIWPYKIWSVLLSSLVIKRKLFIVSDSEM